MKITTAVECKANNLLKDAQSTRWFHKHDVRPASFLDRLMLFQRWRYWFYLINLVINRFKTPQFIKI